jgi:hypothetical protein
VKRREWAGAPILVGFPRVRFLFRAFCLACGGGALAIVIVQRRCVLCGAAVGGFASNGLLRQTASTNPNGPAPRADEISLSVLRLSARAVLSVE